MSHGALLLVTLWTLYLATIAVLVGRVVIGLILRVLGFRTRTWNVATFGAYLAAGLSILSYISLGLGLLSQFYSVTLESVLVVLTLCTLPLFIRGFRRIMREWEHIVAVLRSDILATVVLAVSFAMLATVYLGAMQPPHTSDELNYHFPEAQTIVTTHRVDLSFGGHYFYGNIPKGMEVLYAAGIALSGYPLAHALHFLFFVAFLAIVFDVLSHRFGYRTGVFAVFALLMYDDLTWNVMSGFVDGASFCMEIGALLLFLTAWARPTIKQYFAYAGVLLGIGLSIKYSVAVTALYIGLFVLFAHPKSWRCILIPGVIFAGFWYAKNLIQFGNPFYPLYFGHRGVSQTEYNALIANIQEFKPKTWASFLSLMGYYQEYSRLPVYAAMLAAPLSLFVKNHRRFILALLAYFILYVLYWFFLGTHQLRFFAPAVMAALTLAAITVSKIPTRILLVTATVVLIAMYRTPYFTQTLGSYFWGTKFHLSDRQYALGHITEDEYMYRWYGCYYSAVRRMEAMPGRGIVVDNWSPPIEFNVPFYAMRYAWRQRTDIAQIPLQAPVFMYTRVSTKTTYLSRPDLAPTQLSAANQAFESWFISHGKLIWNQDDCSLYELVTHS